MKKGGKLALVIYILGTLCGGLLTGLSFLGLNQLEQSGEAGWEGLGYALLIVLGLALLVPYAIALILKIIHLKSDLKFFGVLCILFDIAYIACIVSSFEDWSYLVVLVPAFLALISNINSMKN